MIKTKNGKTKITGTKHEILADYSVITVGIVETFVKEGMSEEEAWDFIEFAYKQAKTPIEELKEEVINGLSKLLDLLKGDTENE